jgi:heptosyltransferase-3
LRLEKTKNMMDNLEIKPGDRLLVSRNDKLGDLILAIPFVESLKLRYPECTVDVLASLYASPVLENNIRIDRIVRVQNDQLQRDTLYRKDLRRRLRMANYKVVVALYPERLVSQLFYAVEIPHRIGTVGRFHSVYYNHRLLHSRKSNLKHEAEYNLDFLKYFSDGPTVSLPKVFPTEKEITTARRLLDEAGVTSPFAVLHPGSGGSAHTWPTDRFIRLARLLHDSELQVVFTGSDQEGVDIAGLSAKTGSRVNSLAGRTDLRTLAAVLSLATIVVANSTGPLHLAAAVGTRVVGLYPSKAVMSPVRWGPLGEGHRVIQPHASKCSCPSSQCRCMETISVEQVAREVQLANAGAFDHSK